MNIQKRMMLLGLCVGISVLSLVIYADASVSVYGSRSFIFYIEYIFLDTTSDIGRNASLVAHLNLMAFIIFLMLFIIVTMFGGNFEYRSMLFIRYQKKTKYIGQMLKKIFQYSIALTAFAIVLGILFYSLIGKQPVNNENVQQRTALLVLMFNYILWLNLTGLLNLFMVLKYDDISAILASLAMGGFIFICDKMSSVFSFLTFGSIRALSWGSGILLGGMVILTGMLFYTSYRRDVL